MGAKRVGETTEGMEVIEWPFYIDLRAIEGGYDGTARSIRGMQQNVQSFGRDRFP